MAANKQYQIIYDRRKLQAEASIRRGRSAQTQLLLTGHLTPAETLLKEEIVRLEKMLAALKATLAANQEWQDKYGPHQHNSGPGIQM